MKRANYHTHTARCKHATGTEREYIEAAIKAGMEVLGFSDHVPQPYKEFVSGIRMDMEQLPEYFETLLALKEEYKDKIEIKIGFEVEYIPQLFEELMGKLQDYPVDYLIMGQHFLDEEVPANYVGRPSQDPCKLEKYVDYVLEGLETGAFSYLAHPDLPNFTGDEAWYEKQMTRLCEGCKALGIPLEINKAGVCENKHYPNENFWKIAAKVGNEVILGYDAHGPQALLEEEIYQMCLLWARGMGIAVNEGFRIG